MPYLTEKQQLLVHQRMPYLRARNLLISYLTPEQKEQYRKYECFVVIGSVSGKKYVIGDGTLVQSKGYSYCCHLKTSSYPCEDHFLAQKIVIENDENTFMLKAVLMPRLFPTAMTMMADRVAQW